MIGPGDRIGKWTVTSEPYWREGNKHPCVTATCDCGREGTPQVGNLRKGLSAGCRACGRSNRLPPLAAAHRAEYQAWRSAIARCHDERHQAFANYGGRGITVCEEWRGADGFERFLAHIGPRPSARHSLDRINNERGYEPHGVRWATRQQQNRNKRSNRLVPVDGALITLTEAAQRLGLTTGTLQSRVRFGWTWAEAATYPRGTRPARLPAPLRTRRSSRVAHSAPSEAAA